MSKPEQQSYTPMTKEQLYAIKPGDVVERMLAFAIPCYLIVQSVENGIIDCGWTFSRETGLEIDEDIPSTVSYLRKVLTEEEKQEISKIKI